MKIDIRSISRDIGTPLEADFTLRPEDIKLETEGIKFSYPVHFKGTLTALSRGVIELKGTVETKAESSCDRCLREMILEIKDRVDVIYRDEQGKISQKDYIPDDYDDDDNYFYRGNDLEPDKAVRDGILLAIPFKILCSGECKGFCNKCRTDLNTGSCKCENKTDGKKNQFEELRKLL